MIGKLVSHYKITEKLGEGGMGVVYKAEDTKLGRCVAMKFLPPNLGEDEEKKSRFIHEAKTASIIDHPNIGSIYEINETEDGMMYIVMACYDGESLKKKIDQGPLAINVAVDYALQIAQGMSKAHERSIIHRDLKPANVIITNEGIAKIIDFGLAKLSGMTKLTKSGTTLGTVAYMSPEQARGDTVDVRSDVWSLGIMLFEMLSGKLPFRGDYEAALLYSITNENPLPVETFRTALPFDLKLIIAKALQKDPKDRYQRMDDMAVELKALNIKYQTTDSTKESTEADWKSVTRAIKYVTQKHKVSFIWVPGVIVVLAICGLLIKSFFIKPESTTLSKSIAVLPFEHTGETEQVYFADGFTDELTNSLNEIPQIQVISRQSSSFFKDKKAKDSTIANQLGVRYLIKGKIQSLVGRIKITLFLFDSHAEENIWQQDYDLGRGEILKAKKEIVKEVASQLDIDQAIIKPARYETSSEVYNSYLQGLYYRDRQNKESNILAITFLNEAIRNDSNYIPAYLVLANAKVEQYRQGWDPTEQNLIDAKNYCNKVLHADSNSGQALAMLGIIEDFTGNPKGAVNLLLKSLDRDNKNAVAFTSLTFIYLFKLNEPAKGLMYLKRFQELDPLNWLTWLNLGVAYAQNKNYSEAIQAFHKSNKINPDHEWSLYSLGYAHERMGEFDSSIYFYKSALQINPKNPVLYDGLLSVMLITKQFSAAESLMLRGIKNSSNDFRLFYDLGLIYTLQNRKKEAKQYFIDGLKIVSEKMKQNPSVADYHACRALFNARLGNRTEAIDAIQNALRLGRTEEEIIMKITRTYSILGDLDEVLKWFKIAKSINPEYDSDYLSTALDFEKFRNNAELLSIARQ